LLTFCNLERSGPRRRQTSPRPFRAAPFERTPLGAGAPPSELLYKLRAIEPDALVTHAPHQPLRGVREDIDVAAGGGGGNRLGEALVDDRQARARTELEAAAFVEAGEGLLVMKKSA